MNDRTAAQALILAKAILDKRGWKYDEIDIGRVAGNMLLALKNAQDKTA